MKCSFCGHELDPGSNFCPECGTMMSVDEEVPAVSQEQKYEPDSAEAYSKEEGVNEPSSAESDEEELLVPEYVPHTEDAFEDYNTIRRNEEEAEAAKESEKQTADEEDDPFAELHPDSKPVSFKEEKKEEPKEVSSFDDDDDMYVKPSKSKKGGVTIAVLVVVLVAVIAGGAYAVKKNGGDILSVFKKPSISSTSDSSDTSESTSSSTSSSTSESTTEKKTTEEKSTDKTTEKDSKESTTKKDEKTTGKESTTKAPTSSETTRPAQTTKTDSTTTRPYTTTTTHAYTTKPQNTTTHTYTTRPATTSSPATTAETLKKPTKYYSSAVTRYASENGISIRLRPSLSSSVRASISVGGEVKVYAEENGFYYVYYARYGVYGWVNGKYLSKERPVADSEVKVSGVVKPDKTYSTVETKTVTTSDGLRLRKGPGTNYDTIRFLGKGYPVAVKGTSSKNPGWVYVTDITRGVSGWVSAAYIK